LALETRADDEWQERIYGLENFEVGLVARAERAYQCALGGDCSIPLAGFAERLPEGGVRFRGLVASLDGSTIARAELVAADSESEMLGERVAAAVLDAGGREILESLAEETDASV
jgi:hydroxymethylbilane synthase